MADMAMISVRTLCADLGGSRVKLAVVEDFATAIVDLRERLNGAHLSGDPAEVAESLGMDGFIRV